MRSLADYVSRRAHGVDASGIRKVFDLAAKMKDPINFSIGLPDFDVPDVIKEAAIDAIRAGNNRYTQTQGIAPLRERLRKPLSAEIGHDVGEVLITSGVSGGLLLAILATIDPGDEALFLDPYFVMYKHLLTMAGGKPIIIDSYPDFRFHAERVEKAITPRTKLMILNSPSNPTGVVMSRQEVNAAVEIARKHDLLILSDEIYEPFLYGGLRTEDSGLSKNAGAIHSTQSSVLSPQSSVLASVSRQALRPDDHPARLFQEPRDDRLAAGLRRGAGGDHRADDQATAVHVRLPALAAAICGIEGAGCADDRGSERLSPQARYRV